MQPIGMRLLIQKDTDEFDLKIPDWIGHQLGDILLIEYDGERLTIQSADP